MTYEKLLMEAERHCVDIYEMPMKLTIKGLYSNKNILINKNVKSTAEKVCILAEEIGHYHTSVGNILDQSKIENRKQELRARYWAYERLVPLEKIVQASKVGVRNRYELADYLDVTEEFLETALNRYKEKYGLFRVVGEATIYFDPLGVLDVI